MPVTWKCPYFKWEEGKRVYCECARLSFKTREEREDYIRRYCAANPGWTGCTVAQNLTRKYEREDDND